MPTAQATGLPPKVWPWWNSTRSSSAPRNARFTRSWISTAASGAAATALQRGDHGTTFGGNPVACAAALAVLRTIEADGLLEAAAELGDRLARRIEALEHPLVASVRGVGLWLGVVLTAPLAAAAEVAARAAGFLVNAPAPDVLRLAPPLVLTEAQVDAFLAALPEVLDAASLPGMLQERP